MKRLGFFLCFWALLQFLGMTCPSWADSIKIPLAAPFTGPLASFGEGMKNGALLKADILVMIANLSLCRRSKDRLGKFAALLQTRRKINPANALSLLILTPLL